MLRVELGKGAKMRFVPVSTRTLKAIGDYLWTRESQGPSQPLFRSRFGGQLNRHSLRLVLNRMGKRANVRGVNCHRFRHTFAINFLRNGGDAYSLQAIMGHSDMTMTKRYLALAQVDMDKFEMWNKLKFDVLFVGDDWFKSEKWENFDKQFSEAGVKIVYFPYTQGTSSTLLNDVLLQLRSSPDVTE